MAASFAITASHAGSASLQPKAAASSRGLLRRLFDRFIDAREAQARYEITRYAHIAKFDARQAAALELFARD